MEGNESSMVLKALPSQYAGLLCATTKLESHYENSENEFRRAELYHGETLPVSIGTCGVI